MRPSTNCSAKSSAISCTFFAYARLRRFRAWPVAWPSYRFYADASAGDCGCCGGFGMTRMILVAAALLAVAGCASWIPSLDLAGYVAELQLESEPPGAEARTSGGQT